MLVNVNIIHTLKKRGQTLSNKEKLQHVMNYLSEIEAACVELCGDDDDINTVEVRNIKTELQEVIDDMM